MPQTSDFEIEAVIMPQATIMPQTSEALLQRVNLTLGSVIDTQDPTTVPHTESIKYTVTLIAEPLIARSAVAAHWSILFESTKDKFIAELQQKTDHLIYCRTGSVDEKLLAKAISLEYLGSIKTSRAMVHSKALDNPFNGKPYDAVNFNCQDFVDWLLNELGADPITAEHFANKLTKFFAPLINKIKAKK